MTLDPVHFDGISSLARRIRTDYDDSEQTEVADDLWKYLDPLYASEDHDEKAFYPVESLSRRHVSVEDIALADDEFETQHGLDSGTLNPCTFSNGLVLDLAHAAMASVPSDLELHRKRTLVSAVHSSDPTVLLDDNWLAFDDDHSQGRVVQTSSDLQNHEREAVHAYALYLAESCHLLENLDAVDDILFLDGPIYPKGVIEWVGGDEPVIRNSDHTREILTNYTEAIDTLLEADIPLVGFVKNIASRRVVQRLRDEALCPWSTDSAFFKRVLGREREENDAVTPPTQTETSDGSLRFTNWFVSEFYVERTVYSDDAPWAPDLSHPTESYLPTEMYIYDPRRDLLYKAESPYGFVREPETREALTRQVLKEVALNGVPRSVGKADELARISREQKRSLVESLENTLESRRSTDYNHERWDEV